MKNGNYPQPKDNPWRHVLQAFACLEEERKTGVKEQNAMAYVERIAPNRISTFMYLEDPDFKQHNKE